MDRRRGLLVATTLWPIGLLAYAVAAYNGVLVIGLAMAPGGPNDQLETAGIGAVVFGAIGAHCEMVALIVSLAVAVGVLRRNEGSRALVAPIVLAALSGASLLPALLVVLAAVL